jgi:hypothetical protein
MESDLQQIHSIATKSIIDLEKWIDANGWAGYDPYDLRGTKIYQSLTRNTLPRRGIRYLENRAPYLMRHVLGIKPQINAKSIGLLALGYLNRFQATNDLTSRNKATQCLSWLEENIAPGYKVACWGYPFDWYTRILIPAGTPSSVVSSICGQSFIYAYQLFNQNHYLELARQVADFFITHLNLDWLDSQHACFSYTPVDRFHVHNANLFVAAHLAEVWKHTGEERYLRYIEPAVSYTIANQNLDGSWYYWGPPDEHNKSIDHYHTGFVLRTLLRINQICNIPDWQDALEKGLVFYLNNFFQTDGLPKIYPHNPFPVDIHSCAEAILCLSQFSTLNSAALNLLPALIRWIIINMQASSGYFYYRKYPDFTVKIAYMRWGQAWMFLALACLFQEFLCLLD